MSPDPYFPELRRLGPLQEQEKSPATTDAELP
jgi:hypothetical protein